MIPRPGTRSRLSSASHIDVDHRARWVWARIVPAFGARGRPIAQSGRRSIDPGRPGRVPHAAPMPSFMKNSPYIGRVVHLHVEDGDVEAPVAWSPWALPADGRPARVLPPTSVGGVRLPGSEGRPEVGWGTATKGLSVGVAAVRPQRAARPTACRVDHSRFAPRIAAVLRCRSVFSVETARSRSAPL